MALYIGMDTSNYTTSVAVYDSATGVVEQQKKLLPVQKGALGLRQSDAVFSHVKQLGELAEPLLRGREEKPAAVGVSVRPRDEQGSYMPCFLTGEMAARVTAAALDVPLVCLSHQAGHVAAALFSAGRLDWVGSPFLAFHFSGGTTDALLVCPGTERPFDITLEAGSLDLKAGQAVDRVGGMLGLDFPAGPALEGLARASEVRFSPRMFTRGGDCSLSGIENNCRRMLERGEEPCDVARFCLDSILAVTRHMTLWLRERHPGLPVVYAGGVMSNGIIREAITAELGGSFAEPAFSSDNAAGIAVLAALAAEGHL